MGKPGAPRRHTPQSVLRALRKRNRDDLPVATTGDIADLHGASRPVIKERLEELLGRGDVQTVEVGGTNVYWPVDEKIISTSDRDEPRDLEDLDELGSEEAEKVAEAIIEEAGPALEVFTKLSGEGTTPSNSERDETESRSQGGEEVITDGGYGPVVDILTNHLPFTPRSKPERVALSDVGRYLSWAGAVAIVVVLLAFLSSAFFSSPDAVPEWYQAIGGLGMLFCGGQVLRAGWKLALLWYGYYSADLDAQEVAATQ